MKISKRLMWNSMKGFVALVLVVCLALNTPLSSLVTHADTADTIEVEEASEQYVSELRAFTGSSVQDAAGKVQAAGYQCSAIDINKNNSSNPVVLGYKTSESRAEAITDIRLLQMNQDYQKVKYGEIMDAQMEQLNSAVGDSLVAAVKEFSENYKNDRPAAKMAYEFLNFYSIDEFEGKKLGDYLLSEKGTDKLFLMKMVLRSSAQVSSGLYNLLIPATADGTEENWAQRVAKTGVIEDLLEGENNEKLDELYKDAALAIYPSVQDFTEHCENALARAAKEKEMKDLLPDVETKGLDPEEMPKETIEDIEENNEIEDEDGDYFYLHAYEMLNQYTYPVYSEETGDASIFSGSADHSKKASVLGPAVVHASEISQEEEEISGEDNGLSEEEIAIDKEDQDEETMMEEGQGEETLSEEEPAEDSETMPEETLPEEDDSEAEEASTEDMEFAGEAKAVSEMGLGDWLLALGRKTFATMEEVQLLYPLVAALTPGQRGIAPYVGIAAMSNYLGVNTEELYESSISYSKNIQDMLNEEYKGETISIWAGTDQSIYGSNVAFTEEAVRANVAGQNFNALANADTVTPTLKKIMQYIGYAATVVTIVYYTATLVTYIAAGEASLWTVCIAALKGTVLQGILGALGCSVVVIDTLLFYAPFVVLAVMIGWYIYKKYIRDDEDTYGEWTEIPATIYEYRDGHYMCYDAVKKNDSDEYADLLTGKGKRWNALCTTKSEYAGVPITVDNLENGYILQSGNSICPGGHDPVCSFGHVVAANLTANAKDDESRGVFLFVHREGDDEVINEGEDSVPKEKVTRYLSTVKLVSQESEMQAREELKMKGYEVYDVDLSPLSEYHTFLGFTCTKDPSKAITDLRIATGCSEKSFTFGDVSYAYAGTSGEGDSLYYTTYKEAGSPIYAEFECVGSNEEATPGFEPVNLFCGGPAFNFNRTEFVYQEDWDANKKMLYFHPSVMYTSGTKYISGAVFVSAQAASDNSDLINQRIEDLGYQKAANVNFTKGLRMKVDLALKGIRFEDYGYLRDIETYLCFSYTYNPHRAITGFKTYTTSPTNETLFNYFGMKDNGTTGYAACNVYGYFPREMFTQNEKKQEEEKYRSFIYKISSYLDPKLGQDAGRKEDTELFGRDEGGVMGFLHDLYAQDGITKMYPEDYEKDAIAKEGKWESSYLRAKAIYVCGPRAEGAGVAPLTEDSVIVSDHEVDDPDFISVQDARFPFATKAHELAYQGPDNTGLGHAYIYVKQPKPVKKKYVSSIRVVTFDVDALLGEQAEELSKDQKDRIRRPQDDLCIQGLLSCCQDEIINTNLAEFPVHTYINDPEKVSNRCSYIGVSRTDTQGAAITNVVRYVTDEKDPKNTLKFGGVEYQRCGDAINDLAGRYFLYATTKSSGGNPITEFDFSQTVMLDDAATVLSTKSPDKVGADKETVEAKFFGSSKTIYFLHQKFDSTGMFISEIHVGQGTSKNAAQKELLEQGCTTAVPLSTNYGVNTLYEPESDGYAAVKAKGSYIYIGYAKYKPRKTDKTAKSAVREITMTIGEPAKNMIELDGVTYKKALDRYSEKQEDLPDGSDVKSISLNTGAKYGEEIYLYYADGRASKELESENPIEKIGIAEHDRIPSEDEAWGNVLTTKGTRGNLNKSAIDTTNGSLTSLYSKNGRVSDTRLYLFIKRQDNFVKPSEKITGGHRGSSMDWGNVYLK